MMANGHWKNLVPGANLSKMKIEVELKEKTFYNPYSIAEWDSTVHHTGGEFLQQICPLEYTAGKIPQTVSIC